MIELANGCICCTVADDFLPAMRTILARDPAPDHIVIETSGLALPKPLVAAFNWPEVRNRLTVDGVLVVADAAAVLAGRFAHDPDAVAGGSARPTPRSTTRRPLEELFEEQLGCGDLVLVNKADQVGGQRSRRGRGRDPGRAAPRRAAGLDQPRQGRPGRGAGAGRRRRDRPRQPALAP